MPYYRINEVICRPEPNKMGLGFYLIGRDHEGLAHVRSPAMMESAGTDGPRDSIAAGVPTFFLDWATAQALIDEMHAAGVRPSESRPADDALAATREHIADLRKVAFGLLAQLAQVVGGGPRS